MKTLCRYALPMMLAAVTAVMAGCSEDDTTADNGMRADGKVAVKLHLSVAGQGGASSVQTRAWQDVNATDNEMMNLWVVVVTNTSDGSVVKCLACRPPEGDAENNNREIDEVGELEQGAYTVYSFANISVTYVCTLLGLTAPATIPTIGNTPVEIEVTGTVTATDVTAKTVKMNGNGFDPTANDNGFGEKGIPMSNVQTIAATDTEKDLIVVRMLAKIEVQMFNEAPADPQHPLKVTSVSLTSVTANDVTNLMLLPSLTHRDDMEAHHKDIQPNLYGTPNQVGYTYTVPEAKQQLGHAPYNNGNGTPAQTLTFYVNESTTPTNASGLFFLTLKLEHTVGAGQNQTTVAEYTHALINQTGSTTADDNAWHYIARNDYRIIPVILTDWQFRIEPLAFVPIAGYPAKTLSSDALTATFSTGGPIILQPFVKKWNENTWRDFSDPNITYGVEVKNGDDEVDVTESWKASISWTNSDGTNKSGTGKILTQPLEYDPVSNCIVGVLNNDLPAGTYKTSVTVTVKLKDDGPAGNEYTYSYTCNIVLQK